jgi:hypothetical protein
MTPIDLEAKRAYQREWYRNHYHAKNPTFRKKVLRRKKEFFAERITPKALQKHRERSRAYRRKQIGGKHPAKMRASRSIPK